MAGEELVSLLLFAYNQEQFVRESVTSALSQTYSPLEIILSDDCSSDRSYEIMKEEASAYRGPHRVILNRNEKNLGLARHFNKAWGLSSGLFVVVQACDDVSVPDRVEKLVQGRLTKDPPADLVCSYFAEIDVKGNPTGFVKREVTFVPDISQDPLKWGCGATGACASYSRKLYEKYGPLDERVISEDWVYPFWAWLESGIAVVREPLVYHRTHEGSISLISRNVNKVNDKLARRLIRRKSAVNRFSIAKEWLRAWQIGGKSRDQRIESGLRRLVRIREWQLRQYDSSRWVALKLSISILFEGGGIMNALRGLVRHVFRWD